MDGLPGTSISLVDRAKAIILKPKDEWPKIAAEPATQGDILRSYVLPLAAIGPVASLIGGQIFGYGGFGISYKPGIVGALTTAVLSYVVTIVGVFVVAAIADWLAPKFDGTPNKLNSFKLVAYGATAAWIAGIFGLIPALAVFGLLGLYSLYLFYTGVTPLMAVPEDKRIGYTVVTFIAAAVLYWIIALVVGAIVAATVGLGAMGGAITGASQSQDDVTVSIPGVGTIDTGKMEEAAKRMERMQNGEIKAVPTDTLKALLPENIASFQRTGFSATAMGQAGSGVDGEYKSGDQSYTLKIQDMLVLSGIAGMGAAMGIEQSREDENGYEKIGTVDGQWREETWSNTGKNGTYATMIGNRFRIEASGNVSDIAVLKQAVASVDASTLEKLSDE